MIGIVMFSFPSLRYYQVSPLLLPLGHCADFGLWAEGIEMFAFMPYRIQSIQENTVLMAVPLFVFMGLVL